MKVQFHSLLDGYRALEVFTPYIRSRQILNRNGKVKVGSIYLSASYVLYVALSPNNRIVKKVLKKLSDEGIEYNII